MGKFLLSSFLLLSTLFVNAQIKWLTIEEAFEANKKEPRFILVDVYTDWCGWCKKMDATTFKNPMIAEYISKNYYAVKFNAETKDTINLGGTNFVNKNMERKGSPHSLARKLLSNRLSYPSFAILGHDFQQISVIPGFHNAKGFIPILKYFGDLNYLKMSWEDYQKNVTE